jgi:hypothetical protein
MAAAQSDLRRFTPLLACLSFVPLVVNLAAVLFLLPDVVPLHLGLTGIDRYGAKIESLWVGGLLTVFCILFAVLFYHAEKLSELGLVRGTGVKGARVTLFIAIIALDILSVAVLLFWMS